MLSRFLTVAHSQLTTLNLLGNDILLKFSLNKVTPYRYLVQVLIILTYSPEKKNNLCMIVHFWNWLTLRISICTYKLGILGEGDHRMSNRSIYFTSNWSPNRSKLLKKLIKSWLIKLGCPDCECCFF